MLPPLRIILDLDARPILKALVTDIEELYKLGKEFRYEDLPEGYASICHLCLDIRKHFVKESDVFKELTLIQMLSYSVSLTTVDLHQLNTERPLAS